MGFLKGKKGGGYKINMGCRCAVETTPDELYVQQDQVFQEGRVISFVSNVCTLQLHVLISKKIFLSG